MAASTSGGRPPRFRRIAVVGLSILASVAVLSACDPGDSTASSTTTTKPAPAPPTTEKSMEVHLLLYGNAPFLTMEIKGTKGTCRFPGTGLPQSYTVTAADYSWLGPGGSLTIYGRTEIPGRPGYLPPNIKGYVNGMGLVSPINGAGVQISPDLQSVRVRATMTGGAGISYDTNVDDPTDPLQIKIGGTIRCV